MFGFANPDRGRVNVADFLEIGETMITLFRASSPPPQRMVIFLGMLTIGQQREVLTLPSAPSFIDESGSFRKGSNSPLAHNLCVKTKLSATT